MTEHLFLFALIFTASAATPGPDTMAIFGRALSGGRWAAVPFACGIVLAKLTLMTLVVIGLAVIAKALGPLFVVLKFAGAAYLIWTGINTCWKSSQAVARDLPSAPSWNDAVIGYVMGVTNPHAITFYVALLPSVIPVQHLNAWTFLALAAELVCLTVLIAAAYSLLADRLHTALQSPRARTMTNRVAGGVMIVSGITVGTR